MFSQSFYLLKLLRDQGMPKKHLNTVFHALVMSRLQYALPVWSGYLSVELTRQINSLLKRDYKYGYSCKLHTIENIPSEADKSLFDKVLSQRHCLHGILPSMGAYGCLRPRGTLMTYPVVHLNCTKNHLSHDACISIYDGFLTRLRYWMVCTYRCFSVIVISETICISFDFFSPVCYITLTYITLL